MLKGPKINGLGKEKEPVEVEKRKLQNLSLAKESFMAV